MAHTEIVVVEVDNVTQGRYALDELKLQQENNVFHLEDVALAYRDEGGKVKLQQTTELEAGQGAGWGAGIGLVASLFIGGPIAAALLGAGFGALAAGVGDKGISNEMMRTYESHLNNGHALVFIQVDEANAPRLVDFVEGKAWQFGRQAVREEVQEELVAAAQATGSNE